MSEKIERCPFCGGYSICGLDWYPEIEPGATGTMYEVHCVECGYKMFAGKKQDVISRWNEFANRAKVVVPMNGVES